MSSTQTISGVVTSDIDYINIILQYPLIQFELREILHIIASELLDYKMYKERLSLIYTETETIYRQRNYT
jgi:hypothetical protein